jgi:hypothetical protein
MTRTTIVILSVLATSSLAFSATVQKAAAQSGSTESQQPKVLATIKNGNTEIVFESPDNSDIPMNLFHMGTNSPVCTLTSNGSSVINPHF